MADPLPFNRLRSKLNRAIAAYLVSAGAGSADDVSPANSRQSKGYPNTTVRATIAKPEVPLTGIRRITVHISVKGSAVQENSETSEEAAREAFDQRLAQTADALMQSDDGRTIRATAAAITAAGRQLAVDNPTDHADMADFTCQAWYDGGEGDAPPDEVGTSWEEILIFEAVCSASNVD